MLAGAILIMRDGKIQHRHCETYIRAVQRMDWFVAAFQSHAAPVTVVGGKGVSRADAAQRRIKIGTNDRCGVSKCEQACLHELAHIVSPDYGQNSQLREPRTGRNSSKGHHHAWRVNFILIAGKMLGRPAAVRLRYEFNEWGLSTCK